LPSGSADLAGAGLGSADHPLLGAAVSLADGDGLLLTGRLSLDDQPWLADHAVLDTVLLPGTTFVELALKAGEQVGCRRIEELTLEAPLTLPEHGGIQVQVSVGAADGSDLRTVAVHSRPESGENAWVRHASGLLGPGILESRADLADWPPPGAEPVDLDGFYDRLAERGYAYGPAFQGLRAVWRRGDEVYAEVGLPERDRAEAARFGVHPALLDAALHAGGAAAPERVEEVRLPFSWSKVTLRPVGAGGLRVRLVPTGADSLTLDLADETGEPVASIGSLTLRPVSGEQLRAPDSLFRTEWTRVTGEQEPVTTVLRVRSSSDDMPSSVRTATLETLAALQGHLAGERPGPLVIVTSGATAVRPDETVDPAAAAVWGLVRSAQLEHPGAFALLDLPEGDEPPAALPSGEPQLALREGALYAPRLVRARVLPVPWKLDGMVLVTGGTGALGGLVARHLVTEHGVRDLLLVSRSGRDADGAAELEGELVALGARVTVAACDVGDREALRGLLEGLDRPLAGVVHAAGVVDDGLVGGLTPERLDRVFGPKADAAWYLHELTREMPLAAFVLFSSASATFGNVGQGNYAAANAFLDGLAALRRAEGLAGVSLGWGLWEERSGITGGLGEGDLARMGRAGFGALSSAEALRLLDTAVGATDPVLLPLPLDLTALRAHTGDVPTLLRDLARQPLRRTARRPDTLVRGLADLPGAERAAALLELVSGNVAGVLGYAGPVDAHRAFGDLGFDSLTAVELRDRLGDATGMRLPATLVFDYPTPASLAAHLADELFGTSAQAPAPDAPVRTDDDPVVIVGMACRFPGGVSSPEELWELVASGRDAVSGFPVDRGWDLERLF
ncbi:SDR family NAD(P)-dependent oxidoreductase, partial [Streptosporangium sp. NPDC002721]|uniref:type I polyketide synthase n=1 Tax=Streptosporangium sp. NPDC002721 TaxID=3366188 RepID=UPI00367913E4